MIKTETWNLNVDFNEYRYDNNDKKFTALPSICSKRNHFLSNSIRTIKEDIDEELMRKILYCFSTLDNNFNGKNGEEHLWEKVKNTGYTSNADYLIDKVLTDIKIKRNFYGDSQVEKILNKFFTTWFDNDESYLSYSVNTDEYANSNVKEFTVTVCYDDSKDE